MLRTAFAFLKKDFLITTSYRFNFLMQLIVILFGVAVTYFIGKLLDGASVPLLQKYGKSYFGFLLISAAFTDYAGVSINSFANNIRDGQLSGTIEIILVSPTRLPLFLFSSSLWSYLFTTVRIFLYFLTAIFVFDLNIGNTDLPAAVVFFTLSLICFIGIGIISASLVLVLKKGESIINAFGGVSMLLGGLFFPPEVFPAWLASLSTFVPFTYSLRGLRLAILKGYSLDSLKGDAGVLLVFAALFLGASLVAFPWAVRRAKMSGTLTQY